MPIFNEKKWFCEGLVPGKRLGKVSHCFSIDRLVYRGRSRYQNILIFDNALYGRVFVLDGIVELSEKDEYIYHEAMVHPVLFSHPDPKNILIIGGSDGGVLREVLKHKVKKVDLIELDKKVIEAVKRHLPFMDSKKSFSDKRVSLYIGKGEEMLEKMEKLYDVAIIDCTNFAPGSVSEGLYSSRFYKKMYKALSSQGIMITLGASFLDFKDIVRPMVKEISKVFPKTGLLRFTMPSYHCGEYCFVAGSKKIDLLKADFRQTKKKFKYYSSQMHRASFVLPPIWRS